MANPAADPAEPGISRALTMLRSLLIPGEELQTHAIQRRLFALTHRRTIVGATSGRLIVLTRGLLGGFTPQDVRWQDVRDAQLRAGIFGATLTVSVFGGSDLAVAEAPRRTLQIDGLRKGEAEEVYRACQTQEQAWREKRRVRELEELRAKSGGISLGGGLAGMSGGAAAADGAQVPAARLQRAKEMREQGLLTDAEFEQVKARILADL
jgi:Short C-terminal domain/Bacterial PH domain